MSELRESQRNARYWQNQVNQHQNSVNYWKRRRRDVDEIKSKFHTVVDDNRADVNKKLDKVKDKLKDGLAWQRDSVWVENLLSGKEEKQVDSDANLHNAKRHLELEIITIDGKIGNAEYALHTAKDKLKAANARVKALKEQI